MKHVAVHSCARVRIGRTIEVPLPLSQVWGQLRDFRRFACKDFFHREILLDGPLRQGTSLKILHRSLGVFLCRRGRVLTWEENRGFSFSDLSMRRGRVGFPHIFSYRLTAISLNVTAIHIRIAGTWTMPFVPRPIWKLWLWWALKHIAQGVENDLLIYASISKHYQPQAAAGVLTSGEHVSHTPSASTSARNLNSI